MPCGWHPFDPEANPQGRHDKHAFKEFKWVERWSTRPNMYFVIDFGHSRRFESRRGVRIRGIYGQDTSVPEMSLTEPYDPFPVDVYQVGNMLLRFYDVGCFAILLSLYILR